MAELNVSTESDIHILYEHAEEAQRKFAEMTQEQIDKIFKAAALAACQARLPLAKMAVEETGMGVVEDKVIKNNFASEYIYNKYKDMKTCGVVERDEAAGYMKICEPVGILIGVIPTTNPTSTAIFKALIALKTRNCIIFSPHPRAAKCTIEAARIVYKAAVAAGAPEYCISWLSSPSVALCGILMKHPKTACILATGGPAMVYSAYSSGNPAIGVGPGCCPVVIDEYANVHNAVSKIILSKSFDNGVICASEQVVIAHKAAYDETAAEFKKQGAYIVSEANKKAIEDVLFTSPRPDGSRAMHPGNVGLSPSVLLDRAGIAHPELPNPRLLVIPVPRVTGEIACHEKLSPCVALVKAENWDQCVTMADEVLRIGGCGHTSAMHTGENVDIEGSPERQHLNEFQHRILAGRVIVNSPSAHGALGDLWNFHTDPSLSLGCGSLGKNSISENVQPKHLLNIKVVAIKRENMLWFRVPPRIFFKRGCLSRALQELKGKKKAFIVTGRHLLSLGYADLVTGPLKEMGMQVTVFSDVTPDPTLKCALECAAKMTQFQPDVCIALGGGSNIDLMKIARLLYEHPNESFQDMACRFMDILKRIHVFPPIFDHAKSMSVCIPTTSGTGSEVTPFTVITDSDAGIKYPLADYELTPHMAIVDSNLCSSMPQHLVAFTGLDALTHAIESYVSIMSSDYIKPIALHACKLIFENLTKSVIDADPLARENMHNASCMAGIAFANAFLGINHSLAHKMGQKWHIPHGLANTMVMTHVIRYNSTPAPFRMGTFPQYEAPCALARYAEISRYCGFSKEGMEDWQCVEALINGIDQLIRSTKTSPYVCDSRNAPSREAWNESLPALAEYAFDDQCTCTNPRYPLVSELQEILEAVYSPETDNYAEKYPLNKVY